MPLGVTPGSMQPVLRVPSFSLARSQAECAAITPWVLASARQAQTDVGVVGVRCGRPVCSRVA